MANYLYGLAYGFPFVLFMLGAAILGARLAGANFKGSLLGSGAVVAVILFGKAFQHFNALDGGEATYAHTTQALFYSCLGVAMGFGGLWGLRDQIIEAEGKHGPAIAWTFALTGIVGSSVVATGFTLWMIGAPVLSDQFFYSLCLWLVVGLGIAYFKLEAAKPTN